MVRCRSGNDHLIVYPDTPLCQCKRGQSVSKSKIVQVQKATDYGAKILGLGSDQSQPQQVDMTSGPKSRN